MNCFQQIYFINKPLHVSSRPTVSQHNTWDEEEKKEEEENEKKKENEEKKEEE